MKVLFDHRTPAPLRRYLTDHAVDRVAEKGWKQLENGELLQRAENEGYDVIVTTDQNMRYQQNMTGRQLAIVVLMATGWGYVRHRTTEIRMAIDAVRPGHVQEVQIPREKR